METPHFTKTEAYNRPNLCQKNMNSHLDADISPLKAELQKLNDSIWTLASKCQGDSRALLSLLRTLELLHREVREKLFEISLPDTRHSLYQLLKDMEETGGWPYIERMKLQELLSRLQQDIEIPDRLEQIETAPPES